MRSNGPTNCTTRKPASRCLCWSSLLAGEPMEVSEFDWTEYGKQYDTTQRAYQAVLRERAGGDTGRIRPTMVASTMHAWYAEMDKLADMQVAIKEELGLNQSEVTKTYLRQIPTTVKRRKR